MSLFAAPLAADGPRALTLSAADGLRLSAALYQAEPPKARVLVIAPGFGQRSGIKPMRFIAGMLTPTTDVLLLDFRGTGDSQGRYHFGAEEQQDLQAALAWAAPRWEGVDVMGISLGGYIAVRASAEGPVKPRRLLLVSPPTKVDDVAWSGGIFTHPLAMVRAPRFNLEHHEVDIFFRWGSIFAAKPSAADLAAKLDMPAHFLVGAKDSLVYPRLTRRIFDAVPGPKTWDEWPQGGHAEQMALVDPPAFQAWALRSLQTKRGP